MLPATIFIIKVKGKVIYLTQAISIYFLERRKKILIAPMNWGLGHAARDIPIVRELIKNNVEVILAADGRPLELLRKEFQGLKWLRLPGYDIKYSQKGNLALKLISQLPKFINSFISERRQLKKIISDEKIDTVISDNRYGLYSKKIYSIFITHQTGIMLPASLRWLESMLNKLNRKLIERFNECWIPDFEGENNLSGDLSHKYAKPDNAIFIGPLSRFSCRKAEQVYDVLVLLSGPEPQRTVLENILKEQISRLVNDPRNSSKVLMVRGATEGSTEINSLAENFSVVDFMATEQLNEVLLSCEVIISRPGYSTIMELASLGKEAILIPTPGQTEQEYLAEYFGRRKIFYNVAQKDFNLKHVIKVVKEFKGILPVCNSCVILNQRVDELLKIVGTLASKTTDK